MGLKKGTITLSVCFLFAFVKGQNEVCMFYHLDASCRYRIDGVSLSAIKVSVDQCSDPIKVKFDITNEKPPVQFSHTFSHSDTIVSVRGFYQDVTLQVKLRMKESDVLNVEGKYFAVLEDCDASSINDGTPQPLYNTFVGVQSTNHADFHVYKLPKTDFMNDDIKLHSMEEACGSLNEAGKIAIGVMAGLFAIAAALLVVLLVIRHQRNSLKATQSRTVLVNEPETLETSPPRLPRIDEGAVEDNGHTSNSVENSNGARMQVGSVHNNQTLPREVNQAHMQEVQSGGNQTLPREVNQFNMQEVRQGRKDDFSTAVRFSDISEPTHV